MQYFYKYLTAVLAAMLLTGCTILMPGTPAVPAPAPVVESTETPILPDPLVPPEEEAQCAFVWASRRLPELTELLQAAFRNAQMEDIQADVSAYGENCLNPETKEIIRFATMRTDFYLNIAVEDIEDREALGRKLSTAMNVLQKFPSGTFPGPQPATVLIRFQNTDSSANLSFSIPEYEQALEDGLRGAALYSALD
jgi:hypothetical protein